MLEFVHDFTQILTGAFAMKDEDWSTRNVTPSLDFQSMPKQELLELQASLKKSIALSKVASGVVAGFWAVIFGGLILGVAGPAQGIIIGLIIFFVMYEAKRHEYWRLYFSSSTHFYKPIKIRHLYMSMVTNLSEFGLFGMYTAPFKMFKISREFALANNGRKMNERRALYELNLINKLIK